MIRHFVRPSVKVISPARSEASSPTSNSVLVGYILVTKLGPPTCGPPINSTAFINFMFHEYVFVCHMTLASSLTSALTSALSDALSDAAMIPVIIVLVTTALLVAVLCVVVCAVQQFRKKDTLYVTCICHTHIATCACFIGCVWASSTWRGLFYIQFCHVTSLIQECVRM